MGQGMLNSNRIAELKDEVGEDDFLEVIGMFCEEVEDALVSLDTATAGSLAEKLHFIKGSAYNIGFDTVGDLCAAGEAQLRNERKSHPDILAIRDAYFNAKSALFA